MMNAYQNPVRSPDDEIIAQLYGWDSKTATARTDPMGYFGQGVASTGGYQAMVAADNYWQARRERPTGEPPVVFQEWTPWTPWASLDDPHQRFADAVGGSRTAKEGTRRAVKVVLCDPRIKEPQMWPSINTAHEDFSPKQIGALDPF